MPRKISVNTIQKYKENGEKFSVLTAYDYSTAKYLDEAEIDVVLIGDSLAMVALGYDSTNKIGVEEMTIFTKAVARGVERAMVVTDMPFMSYNISIEDALINCCNMIKYGANAVKIEGYNDYILLLVKRLVESGIPVMAHIGFTPQFINTIGGHNIQGKSFDAALTILEQAKNLEKAGAFSVVLEMVPEESAKYISENLRIPTISCGAGKYCNGQVMVTDDLLGKFSDFKPKFARKYCDLHSLIVQSAKQFALDVKTGDYPNDAEVFKLSDEEIEKFKLHTITVQY